MIKQLTVIAIFFFAMIPTAKAQFDAWQYSGSMSVLTTPEGADLPATAAIEKFPLLVRLDKDFFDFKQAQPNGEDLRLAVDGKALHYQIEQWDAANGKASVWVLMPSIKGNSRQKIQVYWGNVDAKSESNPNSMNEVLSSLTSMPDISLMVARNCTAIISRRALGAEEMEVGMADRTV